MSFWGEREEEERECRICREEGEPDRPLLHPCACSGSIKWCHETCLLDWLKASGRKNVCETCGRSLTFNPFYLPNAPEVLSPLEFVWLFFVRLVRRSPVLLRVVCVGVTWLYALPVFASVTLSVLRRGGVDLSRGLVWALSLSSPFATWEQGMWILFVGFCSMFLLITVVDFVRQYESGVFNLEVEQLRQQHRLFQAPQALNGGGDHPLDLAAAAAAAGVGLERHHHNNDDDLPWLMDPDHGFDHLADAGAEAAADGNGNAGDFDLDDEHDGLEDWIGLRGPLSRMVNHALVVCFFVVMFLCAFLCMPVLPGRALLRMARLTPLPPPNLIKTREGPFGVFQLDNKCYLQDVDVAWHSLGKVGLEVAAIALGTTAEMLCLFAGNLALALWCRFIISTPTWRYAFQVSTSICRIQKVICLFTFKMLIFPIILGFLVEYAARPLLAWTGEDRLFFAAERPHLAVLVLWFTGITHTLLVSVNVILLRDILHPMVLEGVIRTRDPNVNQFLPMLLEPWAHQTKRTLMTCLIYTTIVLLFVALPARILPTRLVPLTSLHVSLFFPSLEVPASLVLFHLWMLTELERNKPRVVHLQERFFAFWCQTLGLTRYLLPVPVDVAEYEHARREVLARAAQMHWLDSIPKVDDNLLQLRVTPKYASGRVAVLGCLCWAVWLIMSLIVLLIPFHVGMLVGYCFPVAAPWLTTDVRWFFVGWYLVEFVGERLVDLQQLGRGIATHVRNVQLLLYAVFFVLYSPIVCGLFSVLLVGPLDATFAIERYREMSSNNELVLCFLADLVRSQPLSRMWFAGLPILAAFSFTNTARMGIWHNFMHGRFDLAVSICLLTNLYLVVFQLVGIACGLGVWKHALVASFAKSPLYVVRLFILLALGFGAAIWLFMRNWAEVKSGCQRIHQSLKDEKYLLGKRLINFES
ncbi:hypothetical protein BASA81_002353 [Batrachochytrium salamandrivorans]|nr:hypothetical protein BASA81_002353 [Batrachochytrium salamandrivorans]